MVDEFIGNDQHAVVCPYLRGGSRFLLWICGSGEVGELIWRGDLGLCTGAVGFPGFKKSGESYWYWYGTQVSYGFQQFGVLKGGTQSF